MGDLDQRAMRAAAAVAAAHGLAAQEATVIHSGSNVLVHLHPAAIVARVMTGTVVLHDDPSTWLERESAVLEFLAPSGLAVAPARSIPPGPHHHGGLWMTFTEWIPDAEPATALDDAERLGRALRDLHDALSSFSGELGSLRDLGELIERLHGQLRPADAAEAAAISSLHGRLDALQEVVFQAPLPSQALHGDVSLRNLLQTPHRLVWNDFEDTFRGPVHWDVASCAISLVRHSANPPLVHRMLASYGWGDEQELAPFIAAHHLYDEIWQTYDGQRRRPAEPPT